MSTSRDRSDTPATVLAVLWTACLLLLAVLWVRSPYTGAGAMFLLWSATALPLAAWSWSRFRRWEIRQLPKGLGSWGILLLVWTGATVLALSGIGGEMVLDGLIMRRDALRLLGRVLKSLPGAFGLTVSVAGLAAALEARYRLVHGEAGRTTT